MNTFDIGILLVLGLFLAHGAWRGALPELCSLGGVAAGLLFASRYDQALAGELTRVFAIAAPLAESLLFLVLFLIAVLVFGLIGFFLGWYGKLPSPGGPSRVVGALFGLVRGVVLLALLLAALTLHPWPQALGPPLAKASLAPPFVQLGEALYRGGESVAGLRR